METRIYKNGEIYIIETPHILPYNCVSSYHYFNDVKTHYVYETNASYLEIVSYLPKNERLEVTSSTGL